MGKKISNIIKFIIISILFLVTIFLIFKQKTKANVLGQEYGDNLGYYAINNGSEFVNENYSNLLNQQLTLKSGEAGHVWGVKYRSSNCLYHNATNLGGGESNIIVKDVIDMGVNSRGEYYATSYYEDNKSDTITGTHALRLAASIKYAILEGEDIADGGAYVVDWTGKKMYRTAVYKYFYQAIDGDGGNLNISNWFNSTYVSRTYQAGYSNIDNDATRKVEAETNSASGFTAISKPQNQSDIQVHASSSEYTVLGPFKVQYGGKDVGSIEIQDANNSNTVITGLTFEYSTSSNGPWTAIGTGTFPNNEDAYIKVIGNIAQYNLINVKFNQKSATFLKARMILCKNQGKADNFSSQNIGYYGYTEGNQAGNVIFNGIIVNPGIIKVYKVDKVSRKKLNFKFKIQTKNKSNNTVAWLKDNDNGTYSYSEANVNNATEFSTTDGEKVLEHLSITECDYRIIETEAPQEGNRKTYILSDQVGYDSSLNAVILTDWFDLNTMEEYTYEKTVENDPRVSIAGYVWVDKFEKGKKPDNYYDSNSADMKLGGVKVTLHRTSDNSQVGTEVTTDNDGKYKFDTRVLYKELNNYYIKFDYSNLNIEYGTNVDRDGKESIIYKSGKEFIPVAYNSADLASVEENGSRAIMDEIKTKDTDLYDKNAEGVVSGNGGIATTYKGTNTNELNKFGLFTLANINKNANGDEKLLLKYDKNTDQYELHDMNLGIKPIYEPVYEIAEDLDYVKILLGGYEYIYYYGNKIGPRASNIYGEITEEEGNGVPLVEKQRENNPLGYEQPMYPTDIYTLGNSLGYSELEVYAVYQIKIVNKTVHDDIELYKEKQLKITSLKNEFMDSRYSLETSAKGAGSKGEDNEFKTYEEKIDDDFGRWSASGGVATYDLTSNPINIDPGKEKDIYIQFKVKEAALKEILQTGTTTDISRPTTAITQGYHEYYREDYSWTNKWYNENLIKGKNTLHESRNKEERDSAPFLRFKLGEERVITGKVFEDQNTNERDNEIIGNGKYDESENSGKNVHIQLVSDLENRTPVKVYVPNEGNRTIAEVKDAIVYSDSQGNYSINGVVPGEYYVIFTYGDNHQKVVDKINNSEKDISSTTYKSTIITSNTVKNAIKEEKGNGENNFGKEWYKHLEANNYSTAVDDLNIRKIINEAKAEHQLIPAITPKMDVTIENTVKTTTKTEKNETSEDNVLKNPIHAFNFGGINFGIIEQPEQRLEITKKITNVKLINTPNVLFNGNPEMSEIPGVTDLDGREDGGSTYTRMEIEKENIYGSELSLLYEIVVTNKSNKNFYERKEAYKGWYYMFGEHTDYYSGKVKISVQDVIDCFDPVMQDITEEDDKNGKDVKTLKVTKTANGYEVVNGRNEDEESLINTQAGYTGNEFEEVLSIKGWKSLDIGGNDGLKLEFRKILSTQEDDLDYINGSGIATAMNVTEEKDMNEEPDGKTSQETLLYTKPVIIPEPVYAESVISAPTGNVEVFNTRLAIISIVAVLSVIASVMSITIVILKRKNNKINYL